MFESASAIFSIADAGEFRFARFYIVCEEVPLGTPESPLIVCGLSDTLRECPNVARDTEFDANIQLEEMLTFFSNEYKVCINIFSVFPLLCRVLSVITAEQIVTGDHA